MVNFAPCEGMPRFALSSSILNVDLNGKWRWYRISAAEILKTILKSWNVSKKLKVLFEFYCLYLNELYIKEYENISNNLYIIKYAM